jgi:hypothetical protein
MDEYKRTEDKQSVAVKETSNVGDWELFVDNNLFI